MSIARTYSSPLHYYTLAKPGIIFGNAITAASGFILASKGHIDFWLFLATLVGLSFVIGSACVFNNYIDRGIDQKMARTKHRPLVTGAISVQDALIFGAALGCCGILLLTAYTNPLTTSIALTGFFVYVALYSFLKYKTEYGTLIGSIAGAVPPVVGYCAVSNRLDAGALIMFMIIVFWQMPHFFAIALYRLDDYAAASLPVLPITKGAHITKIHMLLYVIAFLVASLMLTVLGYTGYLYFAVTALLGLTWLWLCIKGFKADNDRLWARKMFLFSLVIVTVLCLTIAIDVM